MASWRIADCELPILCHIANRVEFSPFNSRETAIECCDGLTGIVQNVYNALRGEGFKKGEMYCNRRLSFTIDAKEHTPHRLSPSPAPVKAKVKADALFQES